MALVPREIVRVSYIYIYMDVLCVLFYYVYSQFRLVLFGENAKMASRIDLFPRRRSHYHLFDGCEAATALLMVRPLRLFSNKRSCQP